MENKFKKNLKHYLISGAIALAVGIGLFCLFFFVNAPGIGYGLVNWSDSLLVTGVLVTGIGGLMFVAHEGLFDIFAYGFRQLGSSMFSKKPTQYNDFPGYTKYKEEIRKTGPKIFLSVLIIGATYLLAGGITYIVRLALS